ncbi:hypothetical protein [Dyadobacter luticola]|uniref:Uncharacterized protein n=1 Tax=Dyadobacter luticola TaxID=1979387 RepID=A0A5R9L204_9BACT|nr:hypothetical protein [Dyadobacter luticola]TLV02604.1 hypothetical protein FEN17_02990 [Dyadobacter luticola]
MKISSHDIHFVLENPGNQFLKSDPEKNILAGKVQELVELIGRSSVDGELSRSYQQQISDAFRKSASAQKKLAPFQMLDEDKSLSREQLLDGLEKLLAENPIDSKISSENKTTPLQKGVMMILAVILIVAGLSMIIMPAPPSFEIFTVYYFNINDGVTVMDLFSLLIIFGGVLMLVLNFNKK